MNAEDKLIENLEHFVKNNGDLCVPFLESEKDAIKNEVLGEVTRRITALENQIKPLKAERKSLRDERDELRRALGECLIHKGWPSETPENERTLGRDYEGKAMNAEEAIKLLESERWPGREIASVKIAALIRILESTVSVRSDEADGLQGQLTEAKVRIAELEDKLRWRDCKTEPPAETGYYLARWNHDKLPQVSGVFFDSSYVRDGWRIPHLTRQPDVWRPIE